MSFFAPGQTLRADMETVQALAKQVMSLEAKLSSQTTRVNLLLELLRSARTMDDVQRAIEIFDGASGEHA